MKKLWAFLSEPRNLAVLVAVGGGLGFVLKEFVLPRPAPKPAAAVVEQSAVANGGAAVNATGAAQVGLGVGLQASAASAPGVAASQRATASGGGVAINASDSAQVSVQAPGAAASR